MGLETVVLAVIIGTLFAIVYSLRILVLMERRIARIDMHMEVLINKVLSEEKKIEAEEGLIERQEQTIEQVLGVKSKAVKKAPARKGRR
jgi:DNA-directed RNA polymerase sigma subunit (sigma70/sigma32)